MFIVWVGWAWEARHPMRSDIRLVALALAACTQNSPVPSEDSGGASTSNDAALEASIPDVSTSDDAALETSIPDVSTSDDAALETSILDVTARDVPVRDAPFVCERPEVDGSTEFDASVISPDPWPESCVPERYRPNPAGPLLLTGIQKVISSNALPDETMTATLNGYRQSYVTFFTYGLRGELEGYGCDGSFYFELPSLAPGKYACPDAKITWSNRRAGFEGNAASSEDCCTLQITRSGGTGEWIEGTFSGILINGGLNTWIKVENGHFAVVARSSGAGGAPPYAR
jgi:hypothetical protein